jgi:hypothetical protein
MPSAALLDEREVEEFKGKSWRRAYTQVRTQPVTETANLQPPNFRTAPDSKRGQAGDCRMGSVRASVPTRQLNRAEAIPVFIVAAVGIRPLVGARTQELLRQIPVGSANLHAVETGFYAQSGTVHKLGNRSRYLLKRDGMGTGSDCIPY